jgi:hypothetical protein
MMRAISSMAHRLLFFSVVTTKKERYRWVQKSTKSMNGLEKRYDTGADCTRCSFGKKMY